LLQQTYLVNIYYPAVNFGREERSQTFWEALMVRKTQNHPPQQC